MCALVRQSLLTDWYANDGEAGLFKCLRQHLCDPTASRLWISPSVPASPTQTPERSGICVRTRMNNRHCLVVSPIQKLWGLSLVNPIPSHPIHTTAAPKHSHSTPCRSDEEALFYALEGCLSMVQASIFCLLDNLEWILPWLFWFLVTDRVERVAGTTWKDRMCRYLALLETSSGTTSLPSHDGTGLVYSWDFQDGVADSPTSRYTRSMLMPWYR